jgi:TonB family protein
MMRALVLLALFVAPIVAEDAVRVNLPLETQTTGAWHIAKASVELPKDAVSPKLTVAPQTTQSKIPTPDSFVSVSFEINEKGLPINLQVDKSSDKELEEEVIAMIREWRFEAALRDGIPIATPASVEVSGGPRARPAPRRRPQQ